MQQRTNITGRRLNMGIGNTVEIFNGQGRRLDDTARRRASNECVRLIRKLRWIGMDDEAERVLAQLSGWPFRPTETKYWSSRASLFATSAPRQRGPRLI